MSKYTFEMFCKDHDEMLPVLKVLKHVTIPEDEWPKINIEGTIYHLNPNVVDADTIGFFRSKYGRSRGADYAMRFLSIMWFITRHHDRLIQKGLIRDDISGQTEIREELLQVMLDSFSPPEPPVIFPTSSLAGEYLDFDLNKVIKAVEPLIVTDLPVWH